MKKTLMATTLLVALAVGTTASQAFTWSDLNPFTWGQPASRCGCEKVCQKDNCGCKPKCKKEKCNKCQTKCDPCQKRTCDPCKKTMSSPCAVPDAPCNACDRLQQQTER